MRCRSKVYDIPIDCCSLLLHVLGFHQCYQEQDNHGSKGEDKLLSSRHPKTRMSPCPFFLPGKKGICFTLRSPDQDGSWIENLPKVLALNPFWNYSWGIERIASIPQSLEFVPMLWGYDVATLDDQLKIVKQQGSRILLAFNEPDNSTQSNIDVSTAIEAWSRLEALGIPLISPSCVHAEDLWMESFMNQVDEEGLRVDAIGVHYYGGPQVKAFQDKLTHIHRKYNRQILITEFAVADWDARTPEENKFSKEIVFQFMVEILPWLESQEWIVGYAWFPFDENDAAGTTSALFHRDGTLTSLGDLYAKFKV